MSPNEKIVCGLSSCGKNITKSKGSLCCNLCSKWYHASCVDISAEELDVIIKSKGALGFTKCPCRENLVAVGDGGDASFREELKKGLQGIQEKFDTILLEVKRELNNQLNELKANVNKCNEIISNLDISTTNKFTNFEYKYRMQQNMIEMAKNQNDILQKRLNRCDIIINGLPKNQPNVINAVQNIFKQLNVSVVDSDINVCFFINNGNSVLVKLNSMFKRDAIMSNYFKTRNLKLSEVIDTDIQKRIFLNDHLTPRAGKLCFNCRKLRKQNKIKKFILINSDAPKVKITFNDGNIKIFTIIEFYEFFGISELPRNAEHFNDE